MSQLAVGDKVMVHGAKFNGEGIVIDVHASSSSSAIGDHTPRRGVYPQVTVVPQDGGKLRHLHYAASDLNSGVLALMIAFEDAANKGEILDICDTDVSEISALRSSFHVTVPDNAAVVQDGLMTTVAVAVKLTNNSTAPMFTEILATQMRLYQALVQVQRGGGSLSISVVNDIDSVFGSLSSASTNLFSELINTLEVDESVVAVSDPT